MVYCSRTSSCSRLVKNSGTGNVFTSRLVCETMSRVKNSFEHNKRTSSSEVGTKTVYCTKVQFSLPDSMMEIKKKLNLSGVFVLLPHFHWLSKEMRFTGDNSAIRE